MLRSFHLTSVLTLFRNNKLYVEQLIHIQAPTQVQSSSSSPSSSVSPEHGYSTGRMSLASSSFLRVSSHWVNCLDSRNICQSEFRISGWRFIKATFNIITRSLRLQETWAADTFISDLSEGDVFLSPLILKDTRVQIKFVMSYGSALCSYVTTIMKEIIGSTVRSVPFCYIPQKASSLPGTGPPFGPVKQSNTEEWTVWT